MRTHPIFAPAPQPDLLPIAVRILVTDDQPGMLDLMDRALGDSYECEFASSIDEARDQLDNGTFHLVICNLDSADSSGLDLAREIVRDHPDTATVVLVTGEDDPEAAKSLFAHGVFGYLVEPFWPGQLLITVMSARGGGTWRSPQTPTAKTWRTAGRRSSTWRRSAFTPKTPQVITSWPMTKPTSSRACNRASSSA